MPGLSPCFLRVSSKPSSVYETPEGVATTSKRSLSSLKFSTRLVPKAVSGEQDEERGLQLLEAAKMAANCATNARIKSICGYGSE